MSRHEVIKHSAVIQMTNRVPALPRRLWNVLLANAYDKLPTRDLFTIPFAVVQKYLDFNSHNYEYLRDALRLLVETRVEFNLLGKDKRQAWGTSSLLSSAILYHSTIEYGYSPHLRRLLYEPSMYARIPLVLPNRFTSKHTLALYELCLDYFDEERRAGETPAMPLETFKVLFDVPNYAWEDIAKRVLKVAIAEITALTPLRIEFRVKRHGRKITDIKFIIRYADPNAELINDPIMQEVRASEEQLQVERVARKKSTPQLSSAQATSAQTGLFHGTGLQRSEHQETNASALSPLYVPRDYDAVFAMLSFEEQHAFMQRAEAALPRLLLDYVKDNPRTYQRLAQPSVLEQRNILLEEYLREQEFMQTSSGRTYHVVAAATDAESTETVPLSADTITILTPQ